MILTVTPNPSVDRTVFVDGLPRGAVIRSHRSRSEPSGKGVNVALALRAHEHDVVAVLPAGGFVGAQLVELLHAAGMTHVSVPITGDIRSTISLVEPDGTVTKLNEAGPVLAPCDLEALTAVVLKETDGVTWLACCGSLPAGAPEHYYATLTSDACSHRSRSHAIGRRRFERHRAGYPGSCGTAQPSGGCPMPDISFIALTPLAFLGRSAEVFADKTAIVYGERRSTYREFAAEATRLARATRR